MRVMAELTCDGDGCGETVFLDMTKTDSDGKPVEIGQHRLAVEFAVMLLENNWGRGYPDTDTYLCPTHNNENWEKLEGTIPEPTDGRLH